MPNTFMAVTIDLPDFSSPYDRYAYLATFYGVNRIIPFSYIEVRKYESPFKATRKQ